MWVLAILMSRSDVRATKDLQGGRHTPNMKEGWLCRTSYDEKNHEIAHMMMTRGDPDRAMIQIQLWWLQEIQIERWSRSRSRSSDDPDPVQWWWSRSSDDVLWRSRLRDDPDPVMKMTWRRRSLEDKDDPVDIEKKISAENRVERIPS